MEALRRCTEIPDKTGRKISEGDIIRLSSFDGLRVNTFTFVVKFGPYKDSDSLRNDIAVGFYLDNGKQYHLIKDTDDVMGIIGNIRDNPELLAQ